MITIAQRLRPFSTVPGTRILLPGSSVTAAIYPARVEFSDISGVQPESMGHYDLPIKGPVDKFTVQLDLEKQRVLVWGDSAEGFFRYQIHSQPLLVTWEKGDYGDLSQLGMPKLTSKTPNRIERLSLGSHKKLDWGLVMRRFTMDEIFPVWFHMGQLVPKQKPAIFEGSASLIPKCCKAIIEGDRNQLLEPFENLLRAGFEGILSPRLVDSNYNGFELKEINPSGKANPLAMMVDGALLIRSLFLQREDDKYKILPALPVPFHSGRMLNVGCGSDGFLDMEWTKKTIRRMVFLAERDGEVNFVFQKELKRFRIYSDSKSQAKVLKTTDSIAIKKGETYILDRFEK